MSMQRVVLGRLPALATGTGAPLLFVGGLSLEAGVEAVVLQPPLTYGIRKKALTVIAP